MKTKIILVAIAILLSTTVIAVKNSFSKESSLSDLIIENIEALTQNDINDLITLIKKCPPSSKEGPCHIQSNKLTMCGEYMYYRCEYIKNPNISCTEPVCK